MKGYTVMSGRAMKMNRTKLRINNKLKLKSNNFNYKVKK